MTDRLREAQILVACGRHAEAEAELDGILAREPEQPAALLLKATVLLEKRQDLAAMELCRRAVAVTPRSAEALNALARCLHALGRDEEALAIAQQAREVLGEGDNFRETAPVYLTLLWCLRELRRYREAVALAEEGLLRSPDAVLAQWASIVEEELAESEQERC
jgi:tetratricopeptide (TPR) repeat protein